MASEWLMTMVTQPVSRADRILAIIAWRLSAGLCVATGRSSNIMEFPLEKFENGRINKFSIF
ncbi:MAG: hypothetical protein AAB329_07300, partial [Pseudomonadota bacterium]